MNQRKTFTTLLAAAIIFTTVASKISADISNAGVLFLRIAPGARPAGMGESFVAIADDATATHWNPAGLGAYPLSDSWKEARVPENLPPITALTALHKEGGKGYLAYDLWAITKKGVARYDNKEWHLGEVFSTRTDESVAGKVKAYFNLSDEAEIDKIVKRVATANNERNYSFLVWLRDTVMVNVPADYNLRETLSKDFDTLLSAYDRCLVNWTKVKEAQDQFSDGMKDGKLSTQEIDRINFAVEKSRNRFVPEELIVPYSAILDGTAFDIAASLELLLVATTENLYAYDGRRWRPLHTNQDSINMGSVKTLCALDKQILVGTDQGLLVFTGAKLRPAEKSEQLPSGTVTAIGARDNNDVWIVINNDLYHYNGSSWSNNRQYTAVLDDTPEAIATKFSIYGTASEAQNYLAKLEKANENAAPVNQEDLVSSDGTRKGLLELMQEMKGQDSTGQPVVSESGDSGDGVSEVSTDAGAVVAESANAQETTANAEPAPWKFVVKPGDVIKVPYLSEVKGKVNTIHVEMNNIWLGTEYGIIYYNGKKWQMPGYRDTLIAQPTTVSQLASAKYLSDTAKMEQYVKVVSDINETVDGTIPANTRIKIPHNPAAASVNEIGVREDKVYFATSEGLLEYESGSWRRSDIKGMDETNSIDIRTIDNELWVADQRKVVIKANGHSDISTMYVKWLPELADDIHYAFLSMVFPKSNLGTFGGNVSFISYGTFYKTDQFGPVIVGEFDAYEVAVSGSFGTQMSEKWSLGLSAKLIHSHLSSVGAGAELGDGLATVFAFDVGALFRMTPRLTLGAALTNIGPKILYSDAGQSDELPRNLGLGFAYKLLQSDFYRLMVTAEMNKLLVGVDDPFSQEIKETIFNGGAEFLYANIFAIRAGYIYDQEGNVKNLTLGAGLSPLQNMHFDFSYIPSGSSSVLANTLRVSLSIAP
ncbi:MAG TPA: PorV/PorQ family protein [candidate division Zixibacteria bacterium]|nr:PorV/PorQ family protein [candidate division Zixibacteria bacterium]